MTSDRERIKLTASPEDSVPLVELPIVRMLVANIIPAGRLFRRGVIYVNSADRLRLQS